jgi:hypothetical protein
MQAIGESNAASRVLDLLESNQSETEFERQKNNNRLLPVQEVQVQEPREGWDDRDTQGENRGSPNQEGTNRGR